MTATPLEIVEVDPAEPEVFGPFHAVYAEATREGQGDFATVWSRDEIRVSMQEDDGHTVRRGWAGRVDGRVVATGWVHASTTENTDLADVHVCCAPSDRGHGYAASMLARVEAWARDDGRSRLVGELAWPYPAGAEGTGSAELSWARSHGFELALVDVQRRLALPVPEEQLDELAAEAAPYFVDYRLHSFTGPVPDGLAEGWAALSGTLMAEVPMGDIEREAEVVDVARLRAEEAMLEKQGRVRTGTAALAPDGTVVAYTDLVATVHESERAYQWGTLVRADHRGHRLGLAVKVANLRRLQETQPELTTVVTFNADVNAPMVAVNDRLGFRPVQWLGEVQKILA
jgi:RimJ/RimL family protein N-acetyltransferase